MSTLPQRPLNPTFIPSLNALLASLALPFTLDHPTDLTPSLLLAVFESLIGARLPIPSSVRQSRTRDAKARAMLVLLGVLECDVLRGGTASDAEHSLAASNADDSVLAGAGGVSVDGWVDEIGLGQVDPERLADGCWEEIIFVGELLCWLARRRGILPRTKSSHRSSQPRSLYSNHHSYGTEGDTADFSTSLRTQKSRSPRPASPSPSVDDVDANTDADFSALSHITDIPRHPLVYSPEPSITVSATTGTDLSIRARSVSSRTSVSNSHNDPDEYEEASQDTLQMYDPRQMMHDAEEEDDRPPTFRPRCIHELEDPSYIRALAGPSSSFDPSTSHERASENEGEFRRDENDDADEQDDDDPYAPPTPTPRRVRLTGWIDPVDTATELGQFAASRAHSRSRAFNESASSGLGPPSKSWSHKHIYADELSKPTSHLKTELRSSSSETRTPRRASPSPSPPSLFLPTSSKHPPLRSPKNHPSSPPSAHSDPLFDVSFSTLNNTSTPAKPRQPRRGQSQTTITRREIVSDTNAAADMGKGMGSTTTTTTTTGRPRRRDRSPSYTPSPPSFSAPGSLRSGGVAGIASISSPGAGLTGSSGFKAHATVPTMPAPLLPPPSSATMKKKNRRSTPPLPTDTQAEFPLLPPPVAPPGSTARTSTLLTERARLLTELAALKRARAASNAGVGIGAGSGSDGSVPGRRIGVGV